MSPQEVIPQDWLWLIVDGAHLGGASGSNLLNRGKFTPYADWQSDAAKVDLTLGFVSYQLFESMSGHHSS